MIPSDLTAAAAPAAEEVEVQINALEQQGKAYLFSCLAHELAGAPRPKRPPGMHPQIAGAIRDIALDQAYALRRFGPDHRFAPSREGAPA